MMFLDAGALLAFHGERKKSEAGSFPPVSLRVPAEGREEWACWPVRAGGQNFQLCFHSKLVTVLRRQLHSHPGRERVCVSAPEGCPAVQEGLVVSQALGDWE